MRNYTQLFCLLICLVSFFTLSAQPIPVSAPDQAGFSADRLARIAPVMQSYIDNGKTGGMISMIYRKGKVVHLETYGMQNKEEGKAMDESTIFRIFSMTKPVASVALMMLYEEGKFQLHDNVADYIPEFKNLKVYEDGKFKELTNKMTIEHLLTHTSGLSYGWNPTYVDTLYAKANIWISKDLQDFVSKIGDIPLNFQPGTKWEYGVSTDIVGYLVEVISGMPFDQFLQERLFGPLKMVDTGFDIPKEKHDRFSVVYGMDKTGKMAAIHNLTTDHFLMPSPYASGGGGLVSTVSDYLRFSKMLLNGGELDGVRILGRKTIELMTKNHLMEGVKYESGKGFGLGFEVVENIVHTGDMGSNGSYRWSGMANTHFWIDPEEEIIAMVWTQLLPYGVYPILEEFKTLVYQALED